MATTAEVRLTAAAPSWMSTAGTLAGGIWRRAFLRALVKACATVFVVITLTFFIVRLMPGNPIEIYVDKLVTEQSLSYSEALAIATSKFSVDLNKPLPEQYI